MGAMDKLTKRRGEAAAPGSDLSGMQQLELIDITLVTDVTGEARQVGRLGLRFDANGVTVKRWDGEAVARMPWVVLRQLEATPLDADRPVAGVSLAIESSRRRHRFVVPNVTEQALTASLSALATRYAQSGLVTEPAKRGLRAR